MLHLLGRERILFVIVTFSMYILRTAVDDFHQGIFSSSPKAWGVLANGLLSALGMLHMGKFVGNKILPRHIGLHLERTIGGYVGG